MTGPQLVISHSQIGAALLAGALGAMPGLAALHAQATSEPQVLYWERDARPATGTPVGMLYTPDVLSALASRMPAAAVPPAIASAIEQRTPLVVMWAIPATDPQPLPPYRIAILDESGGEGLIEPFWIQQHAGDIARLDPRVRSGNPVIAAVAAFPASAFVPGRRVLIRSQRQSTPSGSDTWTQRWGAIRWDGRAGE